MATQAAQLKSTRSKWPMVIKKLNQVDEALADMRYWRRRKPEARFAAMEVLRKRWHGDDYETKYPLSGANLRIKRRKM